MAGLKFQITEGHWNKFVIKLADQLTSQNVTTLKFLCRENIPGTVTRLYISVKISQLSQKSSYKFSFVCICENYWCNYYSCK